MNLAPPVPRKVIVSLEGLLSFTAIVTIEDSPVFYNALVWVAI